jgi:hypothetical protein
VKCMRSFPKMIPEATFVLIIITMSFNDANCIGYYDNYSYASDETMFSRMFGQIVIV